MMNNQFPLQLLNENLHKNTPYSVSLTQTSPGCYLSAVQAFENTMGKGEIAHNKQFFLFPQCFPPFWRTLCHFHRI